MRRAAMIAVLLLVAVSAASAKAQDAFFVNEETYHLMKACDKYNVPYQIAWAIAKIESNWEWKISTPNSDGSYDIGYFELNSYYIADFVDKYWDEPYAFDVESRRDNIYLAVSHMRALQDRLDDWDAMVRAYHSGLTAYRRNSHTAEVYYKNFRQAIAIYIRRLESSSVIVMAQ